MPDTSIDLGSLEGDALARWYLRSPSDIEQERQTAAARRYRNFFSGVSESDPDPRFGMEVLTAEPHAGSNFAASPPFMPPPFIVQDTDPALAWSSAGPNRWRNANLAKEKLSSSVRTTIHQAAAPSLSTTAGKHPSAALQSARPPLRSSKDAVARSTPRGPQGTSYGRLHASQPDDLAELRRQQAEFARNTREIDKENAWLAIPALAPVAAVLGLEGAAALAGRALGAEVVAEPLSFVDREAWQRGARKAAQALNDTEKNVLRGAARAKFARANGISASEMKAEVHHSEPLEWAHLKPNADPNRLANLWGLRKEAHAIATREWGAFARSLEGRLPSQAELMEAKLRIDRLVEPYIRRAGLPRSNRLPGKGGPL